MSSDEELIKHLDEDIISDLHNKGKQYIDRFSNIKMRYKKFAINWCTAYLLALFYICFYDQQAIHLNKFNLIGFATLFTVISIKLIQFLDVNIGHWHLRSIFKYLLLFEKKDSAVIHPYTKVEHLLYRKYFDPILFDYLFYLSINIGISILGVFSLFMKMRTEFLLSLVLTVLFVSSFILWQIGTIAFLIHSRHKKINESKNPVQSCFF